MRARSEKRTGPSDDLLACDPAGERVARVQAVGVRGEDEVMTLGQGPGGAGFQRLAATACWLGLASTTDREGER